MKSEDRILNALRTLAEQDRGREAPQEVEARVLAGFRQRRGRRKLKAVMLAGLAAAAAITLVFVRPQEQPKQVVPSPVRQAPVAVAAVPAPAQKPVPKIRTLKRQPVAPAREIVTEFFPLLDVAPPFERGELLRVTVPMATMRKVGLPVHQDRLGDRVYADVLVGQEGLARAIRFVSYE